MFDYNLYMRKKLLLLAVILVLAALVVYKVVTYVKSRDNYLTVSGRVEANEIELAARIPGKLDKVLIDDGTAVKKGDTVAVIEDKEIQSKRREIINRVEEMNEKIKAAELDLDYTADNVEYTVTEAKKALDVADARLKQAEAKKDNAEKEFTRYSNLLEKNVVSKQKYDNTKLACQLSQEEVTVALKEVERARVSLLKAEDSRKLVKAKDREVIALRKLRGQLQEALQQVDINIGYTTVDAPSDGVILRKVSEPGEILPMGGVIGVMINPEDIYIKTYVPEKYIGSITINMKADIFSDAYPDKPFTGNVCYISDKSEFTPKEVQSYEERVKQVFAIKICFPEKGSSSSKDKAYYEVFKKGMPVDVRFGIKTKS